MTIEQVLELLYRYISFIDLYFRENGGTIQNEGEEALQSVQDMCINDAERLENVKRSK